ncbi:MAG: hypothetical protein ACK4XK_11520 [Casimicrobiaceae bacterium]
MRKLSLSLLAGSIIIASGCATMGGGTGGSVPAVLTNNAGKFVTYSCEGNKSFQLRYNPETQTVRYRGHSGGIELARASDGHYKDDSGSMTLMLGDGKTTSISKKGKVEYKGCGAA